MYVLSVGPAAYGAGKVAASEQDWESLGAPVTGLAIAAGCAMLAARYYRRRRRTAGSPAGPARRGRRVMAMTRRGSHPPGVMCRVSPEGRPSCAPLRVGTDPRTKEARWPIG